MASPEPPPERGTLVIASLLILALGFAGYWIVAYVRGDPDRWSSFGWFFAAAIVIVAIGVFSGLFSTFRRK